MKIPTTVIPAAVIPAAVIAVLFLPVTVLGQGNIRNLESPGQYTKHLTSGQLDSWIFDGHKGETIIAHVQTEQFDPILELAAAGEEEDKVLFAVDDEGSQSRFSFRLPQQGRYKIRIHAFKYEGGGNYALQVRRFRPGPLEVGNPLIGTFDRQGKGYHYFRGVKDRTLTVKLKGAAPDSWQMLDVKGRQMEDWSGSVSVENDGQHCLIVSGDPDNRYDLLVREARRRNLSKGQGLSGRLEPAEMDVWSFTGEPGQFCFLEVEAKGMLASRLIYAPLQKTPQQRIAAADDLPEMQLLPVASKGSRLRWAALLGRPDRYQLQLLAETPTSYTLAMDDPCVPIQPGREAKGSLAVGGAAFYSFQASPGRLFEAGLASQQFDPLLRLYDGRGNLLEINDDGADGLNSRIAHMIGGKGLYRLHVCSLGDGGGGRFGLTLRERKLQELQLGGRGGGTLHPGSTDFWAFPGKQGKSVLLSVRSSACDPAVSLHGPDGVALADDDNSGVGTDSLLAVKLPKTGRYTIWISSRRGVGEYTLRLIDGD